MSNFLAGVALVDLVKDCVENLKVSVATRSEDGGDVSVLLLEDDDDDEEDPEAGRLAVVVVLLLDDVVVFVVVVLLTAFRPMTTSASPVTVLDAMWTASAATFILLAVLVKDQLTLPPVG